MNIADVSKNEVEIMHAGMAFSETRNCGNLVCV